MTTAIEANARSLTLRRSGVFRSCAALLLLAAVAGCAGKRFVVTATPDDVDSISTAGKASLADGTDPLPGTFAIYLDGSALNRELLIDGICSVHTFDSVLGKDLEETLSAALDLWIEDAVRVEALLSDEELNGRGFTGQIAIIASSIQIKGKGARLRLFESYNETNLVIKSRFVADRGGERVFDNTMTGMDFYADWESGDYCASATAQIALVSRGAINGIAKQVFGKLQSERLRPPN